VKQSVTGLGGALSNSGIYGIMTVSSSILLDNQAVGGSGDDGFGGAIVNFGGAALTVKNGSTFTGNQALGAGSGASGIGGAIDMAMRKIMLDHGMQEKRDYRIVEVEFPNMTAALKQKKVDLAGEVTPFSIAAHKDGILRTLFTLQGAMGPAQTTLLAARAGFIKDHRAELVDFFEDWIRATRGRRDSSVRWMRSKSSMSLARTIAR